MRVLCLFNNIISSEILNYLLDINTNIIGLILHPDESAKYKKELKSQINDKDEIFINENGHLINSNDMVNKIYKLAPDIILSVGFGYILEKEVIDIPSQGAINLHTSYLPYNRGSYPNIWSIVEKTPAGVTLHYIDQGIDTGNIISKRKVKKEFKDTGKTLHRKLQKAAVKLFRDTWPDIANGKIDLTKQSKKGSFHLDKDIKNIEEIILDKEYKARDLLNIIRAMTFRPYDSTYVIEKGKKYYLRLDIEEAKDE